MPQRVTSPACVFILNAEIRAGDADIKCRAQFFILVRGVFEPLHVNEARLCASECVHGFVFVIKVKPNANQSNLLTDLPTQTAPLHLMITSVCSGEESFS